MKPDQLVSSLLKFTQIRSVNGIEEIEYADIESSTYDVVHSQSVIVQSSSENSVIEVAFNERQIVRSLPSFTYQEKGLYLKMNHQKILIEEEEMNVSLPETVYPGGKLDYSY